MRELVIAHFVEEYRFFPKRYQKEQLSRLSKLTDKELLGEYTDSIMDRFCTDYD